MTDASQPPPAFSLRPLAAADADAAARLIRDSFGAIRPPLVPPPSALRETAATVVAHLASGGGEMGGGAVADASGCVVGVVLWGERDGGLYLGRLSVAPAFRRAGVARALIGAGERAAKAACLPRTHVGVRLLLDGNRRLFTGLGYGEVRLHRHEGFPEPTWVEMEKHVA